MVEERTIGSGEEIKMKVGIVVWVTVSSVMLDTVTV